MQKFCTICLALSLYLVTNFTPVTVVAQLSETEKKEIKRLFNNFLKIDDPLFHSVTGGDFQLYRNSCNNAALQALHIIYKNNNVSRWKGENGHFILANDIYTHLSSSNEWQLLGGANDVYSLNKAQCYANKGYQVVAVSQGKPHGHVALIMPGKLVRSNSTRKWYPSTFSFFLDKPDKAFAGKGMRSAWSPCAILGVKFFYRAKAYDFFNPYQKFRSAYPVNLVEQHPESCEENNILPNDYQEIIKPRPTLKITGFKFSGNTAQGIQVHLSGYIIKNHDEQILKIDWENSCLTNGNKYSGTITIDNASNIDNNIHCWEDENITICNGVNNITVSVESTSGGQSQNILLEHYPASFPTEVLEGGNGRQVASTLCDCPYGITIDGIASTDNGKRILSGCYKGDLPITGSFYSLNKINYDENELLFVTEENPPGCFNWKTEEIDITNHHGVYITFILNNKVIQEFFSLPPKPEDIAAPQPTLCPANFRLY